MAKNSSLTIAAVVLMFFVIAGVGFYVLLDSYALKNPGGCSPYCIGTINNPPLGAKYPAGSEYPSGVRYERVRVIDGYNAAWSVNYNAQQILAMINRTQPQVLERMTNGRIDLAQSVPVCGSCSPMTYGQFLDNAMALCTCYIIPRIGLAPFYSSSGFDFQGFDNTAQNILSTQVTPAFQILSIDDWGVLCKFDGFNNNATFLAQLFSPLYQMGWKGVGVLTGASPYCSTGGWATWVDFSAGSGTWTPSANTLAQIKADPTVQKTLLYLPDLPNDGDKFLGNIAGSPLSCTPQNSTSYVCPDALISTVQTAISNQNLGGYTYVYPLQQGDWDANKILSTSTGVYSGQSLYRLFVTWMGRYNN